MNMDLVVKTEDFPRTGETVFGNKFEFKCGGKGANQALTIAKLGGFVNFIGACGRDEFGDRLIKKLNKHGVNTDDVFRVDKKTGIALISIDNKGNNKIIVVPGANNELSITGIDNIREKFKRTDLLLLQLEIPLKTVIRLIELAAEYNTRIILDPAPAAVLPDYIYQYISYITPNESELNHLMKNHKYFSIDETINHLLSCGLEGVILTRGEKGVKFFSRESETEIPAYNVRAVDTTAAGDVFAGSFAFGLQQGWNPLKAIKFASKAAAISVQKLGAQASIPAMEEIKKFKEEKN